MQILLAWRNLWRNRRRTFITVGAIFFSVLLAIIMSSFQRGTWDQIIGSVVEQYTGYGQIHQRGYWDEQKLNNSMPLLTKDSLGRVPANLQNLVPRLESFALGAYEDQSRGTQVVGIDPLLEDSLTGLADKVVDGTYLAPGQPGLLIGEGYARIMGMGVGDTLIFLGQGYHGVTAVGKYAITGIVKFGNPELNKSVTFLPLEEAQYLFGMPGRVTAMVLQLDNTYAFAETVSALRNTIDTARYEVMGWREMNPSLVQAVQADTGGMVIMLFVIYLVIAFGIFSTVLMMTAERRHEFGILLSIGMKRWRMQLMMFFETLFLALIGILAGILGALPVMAYFGNNPIEIGGEMAEMYEDYGFQPIVSFATQPEIILNQALIILLIILAVYIYPWFQLRNIDAVESRS
jgi:ABC-type lipoprotein release transport system permease subunit